jgi:hypothetical protein
VLDDPAEQGAVALEEDDLALHGGCRCVQAEGVEQPARPGSGGDDDRAARDRTRGCLHPDDSISARLEADDRLARPEDRAATGGGHGERPEVPRVTDLRAVGQEVGDAKVGAEHRLDAVEVARREPFVDDPLRLPSTGHRAEVLLLIKRPAHVHAAGPPVAVVDPRLLAESGRPFGVKHRAPRSELDHRVGAEPLGVRRDQARAGP